MVASHRPLVAVATERGAEWLGQGESRRKTLPRTSAQSPRQLERVTLSLSLSPSPSRLSLPPSLSILPSPRLAVLLLLLILLLPPFARSLRFLLSSLAFAPFHQDVTLPSPSPLPHSLSLSPRDSFFLLPPSPSPLSSILLS